MAEDLAEPPQVRLDVGDLGGERVAQAAAPAADAASSARSSAAVARVAAIRVWTDGAGDDRVDDSEQREDFGHGGDEECFPCGQLRQHQNDRSVSVGPDDAAVVLDHLGDVLGELLRVVRRRPPHADDAGL